MSDKKNIRRLQRKLAKAHRSTYTKMTNSRGLAGKKDCKAIPVLVNVIFI